jgi:plastocyanin
VENTKPDRRKNSMGTYGLSCTALIGVGLQLFILAGAWGYEVVEVTDGGTISGEVKFAGEPPVPAKVEVTKDQEVCGKTEKIDESLVVGPNKGIKDVVVSIRNIQKGKKLPDQGAVLDQRDCRYAPHVVLTPAGVEMSILNSDGILHNIHSYSTKNPPFNKAQPKFRKEIKEKFAEPEVVKLTCDAHGWMSGWVIVMDHPYYAVTGDDGTFALSDVPPGEYELQFWHETLGEMVQKVVVEPKKEAKVTVEMARK